MNMKRFLAVVLVATLALATGGCGSLDREFVDRMEAPSKLLLPDLRSAYEGKALTLTEEQRIRRRRLLDEWERTIAEAVKASR